MDKRMPLIFLLFVFSTNAFTQSTPDTSAYSQIVAIEQQLPAL